MRPNLPHTLFACIVSLFACGDASAQTKPDEDDSIQFSQLGAARGMRQYVRGTWGIVGVELINPANEPTEVLATFGTAAIPDIEFARRIQVPARSMRRTWIPIKVPNTPREDTQVRYLGKLIDTRSGAEVVIHDRYEGKEHAVDLRINHDAPVTGMLLSNDAETRDSDASSFAYEALIALRTARGFSRRLVLMADRDFPPTPETLDGMDQLVLCNDRFADTAAFASAIRAWVNDGGQLWIMLDQVDFRGVEQLLGNVFTCGLIDRVQLDTVEIHTAHPRPSVKYATGKQYEQPVDFARVVTTDMFVTHTLGPWPAAFWRHMGRGRVVFTTVGAKGWIQRPQELRGPWNPNEMTDYVPTPQLEDLPLRPPGLPRSYTPESFQPYLAEQIGYRVVSRGPVLAILGLFCGCLLAAGVTLARAGRLERMRWIVPGAALLASMPLIWFGTQARHAVAPTVGQAQLIEAGEEDGEITASGLLAVYNPTPSDGPLGAQQGGISELDGSGLQGNLRRMVWSDLGQWRWENLHLPAGVRTATFHRTAVLDQTVRASGTFTEQGFQGRVTGPFSSLADVVIATPGLPCMAARAHGTAISAGPEDVLPPGHFVSGTLLSDEQARRQAMYAHVLNADDQHATIITRPTLLGWSEPTDMGFEFRDDAERVGAALWAIPLDIARPKAGTTIVIPSSMVSCRSTQGLASDGFSPLFNARTGQWIRSTGPSRTWLRFQVPRPLLPIEIQELRLTMQITAPDRRLEIVRLEDGQLHSLSREMNPIGRFRWTVASPDLPSVDDSGGFLLGVSVETAATAKNKRAAWKIDLFSVEVRARIP